MGLDDRQQLTLAVVQQIPPYQCCTNAGVIPSPAGMSDFLAYSLNPQHTIASTVKMTTTPTTTRGLACPPMQVICRPGAVPQIYRFIRHCFKVSD